ncbi:nucleotidyl transferase AbiEii/AbiGii toxin family protein, partial [Vibrio anguillarum]|nr:nucleotidyl transferase AbiEii/AbiGii toxin family protein [Vibrio anguillarum]
LDKLTFQGGTSLRLCYGGNRFSEDLDFAGGKDFSSAMLADMKHCIEKYIGERYGLEVTVKEPKDLKQDHKYSELSIDKWQIAVVTS